MSSKFQVPSSKFGAADTKKDSASQCFCVAELAPPRRRRLATWNLELGTLLACAACGSANPDMQRSPLADGMNLGILTLLGILLPVLGCFAFGIVRMINKEQSSDKNSNAPKHIADV